MSLIAAIILLIGIVQMTFAVFIAHNLGNKTEAIGQKNKWRFIQVLISFFLISYIGLEVYIVFYKFIPFLIWVAIVYCFGATFVLLMLTFAKYSLDALATKQQVFITSIFESLGHPIYVINTDDRSIAMSNQAAKSEIPNCGNQTFNRLHENEKVTDKENKDMIMSIIKNGRPFSTKYVCNGNEGEAIQYEINAYPVFGNKKDKVEQIIVSIIDISAIIQLEKISTINSMVITYNHEINNPLTIALGHLEMGMKELQEGDSKKALETVKEALHRIAKIVKATNEISEQHNLEYGSYCSDQMIKIRY